jgi:REP element-mobilizing transposase RayT
MKEYKSQLRPNGTYHIYNRAIGNEKLFLNSSNYTYFLKQYKEYISPVCDTFCYCLLPNHFHFLIRCKTENEIEELFVKNCKNALKLTTYKNLTSVQKEKELSNYISKQFSNLFNGYTQALNKREGRTGNLFSRAFNRIEVSDEIYLRKLVLYIHQNPVEAKLCNLPTKWTWSSYNDLISESTTFLLRYEILDWFENRFNFISMHEK